MMKNNPFVCSICGKVIKEDEKHHDITSHSVFCRRAYTLGWRGRIRKNTYLARLLEAKIMVACSIENNL
jgi:hypothetical protein